MVIVIPSFMVIATSFSTIVVFTRLPIVVAFGKLAFVGMV